MHTINHQSDTHIDNELATLLVGYADAYETPDFLTGDPSWFMHQVSGPQNQEAMAFLASCLSYGSRSQFLPKIQQLLDWSCGEVHEWVATGAYREHFAEGDTRCFYRLYNMGTMRQFLDVYQRLLTTHSTLGRFVANNATDGHSAVVVLSKYFGDNGVSVVVPKDAKSACKRLCMFLRWMVRTGSPVDLGLWSRFIDRRTLIMPLDTHVVSQAMRLGMLHSRSASMSAAQRLTQQMTRIFPDDPLRGDFALFGYGVNH